ncbi:MAG: ribonuclease D [Planctomycetota bacterium]|nr:ribonuclease D [Planctomycetota bacterium]
MPSRIPSDWPEVVMVTDAATLSAAVELWSAAGVIGVDTEANSFFAYHERLCLVQVSAGDQDWIIDPIALGDDMQLMAALLEDPKVIKVFHAAEFDLMLLKKEMGVEVKGLFDTQVAMTFLRHQKTGLAALIESYYGVKLSKDEQRSNWGKRPLSDKQIAYARIDTHFLVDLYNKLRPELEEQNMVAAAYGEFERQMSEILSPASPSPDRYLKLKGARKLNPSQLAKLKAVFELREEIASSKDIPPFKVLSNQGLIGIAETNPRSLKQLAEISGVGWKVAKRLSKKIFETLGNVADEVIETKVKKVSQAERRARQIRRENTDALKVWRTAVANELDLPSERLIHRRQLEEIANALPQNSAELNKVVKLNDWQREQFESSLLLALEGLERP